MKIVQCALLAAILSAPLTAQIRPYDVGSDLYAAGDEVDKAIAESERHGERDTKERLDLIVAVDKWYQAARAYADVERHGRAIEKNKALIAVLSCVEERAEVKAKARAYSEVNGTPSIAELKSRSIEHSLREKLADRLFQQLIWEANRSESDAPNQ